MIEPREKTVTERREFLDGYRKGVTQGRAMATHQRRLAIAGAVFLIIAGASLGLLIGLIFVTPCFRWALS
jgi:hypothetical protein